MIKSFKKIQVSIALLLLLVPSLLLVRHIQAAPIVLPADAKIVFNPTGTQLENGQLKIRLDIYFGQTSKSYAEQFVNVVDETSSEYIGGFTGKYELGDGEYQKWLDSLPHLQRLNPALSVFIAIDEATTKEDLSSYTLSTFTGETLATLDDSLTKIDSGHLVSPYLKGKLSQSSQITTTKTNLITDTNAKFASLNITGNAFIEPPIIIKPKSIDVGPGSVNRGDSATEDTWIDKANPANDTGTIDTFQVWLAATCLTNGKVGLAYVVSDNNLTLRSSANVGTILSGSTQTFTGLSLAVSAGDYASMEIPTGSAAIDTSGGAGSWYLTSDVYPFTNQAFSTISGWAVSLYATGTEASTPFIPQVEYSRLRK